MRELLDTLVGRVCTDVSLRPALGLCSPPFSPYSPVRVRSVPYVHKVLREIEVAREIMLSGTLSGTEEGGLLLKDAIQQRNQKVGGASLT